MMLSHFFANFHCKMLRPFHKRLTSSEFEGIYFCSLPQAMPAYYLLNYTYSMANFASLAVWVESPSYNSLEILHGIPNQTRHHLTLNLVQA